jgi:hypothetical protein
MARSSIEELAAGRSVETESDPRGFVCSGRDGLSGRQRELENLIVELGRHAEAVATSQPCAT